MTEPMKRGALARTIRGTNDLCKPARDVCRFRRYPPGFEFEVEDYVPDGEVGGKPAVFYWGNANGGMNNVCVLAEDVEQAKSAEEMAARSLPETEELLGFIASALLTDRDGIDITEVDRSGGAIEAYGKTEDGLTFGFSFHAEISVWRTDD
jgi:hypothetical protein